MNAGRLRIPRSLVPTAALALALLSLLGLPAMSSAAGPEAQLTPTTHNFGQVIPGETTAPFHFTLESIGTEPLTIEEEPEVGGPGKAAFIISTPGAFSCQKGTTLKPGQACAISVSFKPAAVESYEATLLVSTTGGPVKAPLRGEGAGPEAQLTPAAWGFGNVPVGKESEPFAFTLKNISALVTLEVEGIESSSSNFTILKNLCEPKLAPGEGCEVLVSFTPQSNGPKLGALVAETSAGTRKSELIGEGVTEEEVGTIGLTPSPFNFGEQEVGVAGKPQQFTIENTGGTPVLIESVKIGGTESSEFFLVEPGACKGVTIGVGKTCTVEVAFDPISEGVKEALLEVKPEAGVSEATSKLLGTGVEGKPVILPAKLNFGEVKVGTVSAPASLHITNKGSGPLTVKALALEGASKSDFSINSGTCKGSPTLKSGESCEFEAAFEPTALGVEKATVVAVTTAGSVEAELEGTGV